MSSQQTVRRRWHRPLAAPDQYKCVADGPTLFDELIPPPLSVRRRTCHHLTSRSNMARPCHRWHLWRALVQASTHTSTLSDNVLYVLCGESGTGGALQLHMLHTPTLSWRPCRKDLAANAPRLASGHSAALIPAGGGIFVFGGVRSDVT